MTVATIRIQLDDKTAQLLDAAPADRRAQLNLLIRNLIEQFAESDPAALFTLMDEMSREAGQNGMTPAILANILGDQMIIDLEDQEDRYAAALERQLALLEEGIELGSQGTATWTPEELHER